MNLAATTEIMVLWFVGLHSYSSVVESIMCEYLCSSVFQAVCVTCQLGPPIEYRVSNVTFQCGYYR